jgi:hypothetical protein
MILGKRPSRTLTSLATIRRHRACDTLKSTTSQPVARAAVEVNGRRPEFASQRGPFGLEPFLDPTHLRLM